MTRPFTIAALALLLASPAMAQNYGGSSSTPASPPSGSSTYGQPSSPGAAGNVPTDCAPNDVRPECQSAQLPSTDSNNPSTTPPAPNTNQSSPGSMGGSSGGTSGSP